MSGKGIWTLLIGALGGPHTPGYYKSLIIRNFTINDSVLPFPKQLLDSAGFPEASPLSVPSWPLSTLHYSGSSSYIRTTPVVPP